MTSNEDPDAWLGLLKWSLSHQDGTVPSEARPMGDEDRAWLEKVVSEGVRDDFKAMTDIYGRLCTYLDLAATNPSPALLRSSAPRQEPANGATPTASGTSEENSTGDRPSATASGGTSATGTVTIGAGIASDFAPPPPPPVDASATPGAAAVPPDPMVVTGAMIPAASSSGEEGALSTFIATPHAYVPSSPPAALPTAGAGAGAAAAAAAAASDPVGGGCGTAEELKALEEGVINDLDELQEIVEQIDAAATFAKIGGFGRLIALVAHTPRPEKLRLRAASVIATLTKNNPPAQAAFSSSGGHKSLLEAVSPAPQPTGTNAASSAATMALSLPLQRAILHALSSSVMGLAPVEDALCLDPRFQEFLARALSQEGAGAGAEAREEGDDATVMAAEKEESCRLRSKAAFVLKALISAPEASRDRAEALWPAVSGLVTGLEALAARGAGEGEDDGAAAARETCIEAVLATARSVNGDRVVRELGARVARVAAARRQTLVEAAETGTRSREDADSAEFELGLWLEWDALTGPAQ
ncbi:unnamed protein product [Pylaiella littoralis]